MEFVVRLYQPGDYEAVISGFLDGLLEFAETEGQRASTLTYTETALPRQFTRWDTAARGEWADFNVRYWVAADESNGKIVGGAGLEPTKRQKKGTKEMATVDGVFTVPAHRRKGIGKRLMERLESHARSEGIKSLRLTSQTNLTSAVLF